MEVLCVLTFVLVLLQRTLVKSHLYWPPGMVALLLFLSYHLVQIMPLPPTVIETLSPKAYEIYMQSVGVFEDPDRLHISLNRGHTLAEFYRFAAYTSFYMAAVQLLADRRFFKKTVHILVVFGALLAFAAMLQRATNPDHIFWFKKIPGGSPFGPYVNRNHWAGLMEMLFPLAVGLFFYYQPRMHGNRLRRKLAAFSDDPGFNRWLLVGFGALLMGVSVFACISRGGILGLCLSVCVISGLIMVRKGTRGHKVVLPLLIVLMLFAVGWFGWKPVFERFDEVINEQGEIVQAGRLQRWGDALPMLLDFKATGSGMGTFREVFETYNTQLLSGNAHNDYIEFAAEGGIPTVVLAAWLVLTIFGSVRRLQGQKGRLPAYVHMGALGAFCAILLHSIFDFNLHNNANGLFFFFTLAICVVAVDIRWTMRKPGPTLLKMRVVSSFTVLPVALILLIFTSMFSAKAYMSYRHLNRYFSLLMTKEALEKMGAQKAARNQRHLPEEAAQINLRQAEIESAIKANTQKWVKTAPQESFAHFLLGHAKKDAGDRTGAQMSYQQAVQLSPASSIFISNLARHMDEQGEDRIRTEKLLLASIARNIHSTDAYARYGLWLIEQDRKSEGLEMVRKAITVYPRGILRFIQGMEQQDVEHSSILGILPFRVVPLITYAKHLEGKERPEAAESAYDRAIDCIPHDEKVTVGNVLTIHRYYRKQKKFAKALSVITLGIQHVEDNPQLHIAAGRLHEKLKNKKDAMEAYRQALRMEPKNRQARKRLNRLRASVDP